MAQATERIIALAKRAARAEGSAELGARHFLIAACLDAEARSYVGKELNGGAEPALPQGWRAAVARVAGEPAVADKIPLGAGFKELFQELYSSRRGFPPFSVLIRRLLLASDPAVDEFKEANPGLKAAAGPETLRPLSRLGRLVDEVSALRNKLLSRVIGQAKAIERIADALFAAGLYPAESLGPPRGSLLFLGPPGVGKNFAAELIGESLCADDPEGFLRLDMSAYSDPSAHRLLTGFEPSFAGARPGLLTGHVSDHPAAVVLVENLEQAHASAQSLFARVLDSGMVEDKFLKKKIPFGKTVFIFSTGLGGESYEAEGRAGAGAAGAGPAALAMLREARDPLSGQPAILPELCSKLARCFPAVFRPLPAGRLKDVARHAVDELDLEFLRRLGIRVTVSDPRLLTLLLLRLGPDLDACGLAAGVPRIIKDGFRDALIRHRSGLTDGDSAFERLKSLELRPPEGEAGEFFKHIDENDGPPGAGPEGTEARRRDRFVESWFRSRKAVSFEWSSELKFEDKRGVIILRPANIVVRTAVSGRDLGARLSMSGVPTERFSAVAGAGEAKRRLREIIQWMRAPETIRSLGVDLPTGILLEGPSGNGKTLLARAVAGEAGLPFFAANATDFASKWVGESERNVRELFERAAAYAPSILFLDELDAIGSRRDLESSAVHDQVLTQLLVCMDGFARRERPVFFLAATNRADLLDPALKRPGRFDYVIFIGDLDLGARAELLRLKTAAIPLAPDVDLAALARACWGFSGAMLAQAAKEAAVLAFRDAPAGSVPGGTGPGGIRAGMKHFREAVTNVRHGLARDGARPTGDDLRLTAYHEAGHALIAESGRPGSVTQATVLPRGRALGLVDSLPEGEDHAWTMRDLLLRVRVALAGRCAEIIAFGEDMVSAGSCRDLETATRAAALAVTRFGMSREIGPLSLPELERALPGSGAGERAGREVERMVREQEKAVLATLGANRAALDELAELLMERETVDGAEVARVAERIGEK
ncbi:MAG TPA: AAA family ATPase [bacterium]|nr:AAA family ATPase [bacterium]